jgi:putative oxidoreductase
LNAIQKLFETDSRNVSALIVRVILGGVIFAHGAQKLFGWFGGAGLDTTISVFYEQLKIPSAIALLVILIESLGAIFLILGFGSRIMAFGIMCVMIGAIGLEHIDHGFFMNWHNNKAGEGFEYHLLAIASALSVMLQGGGLWSIDSFLGLSKKHREEMSNVHQSQPMTTS